MELSRASRLGRSLVIAAMLAAAPIATMAQVRSTSFFVSESTGAFYSQTCAAASCSFATPITMPTVGTFEIDSTGGRLRGRARVEPHGATTFTQMSGVVSYSTTAHASLVVGAPITLAEIGQMSLHGNVMGRNFTQSIDRPARITTQTAFILLDQTTSTSKIGFAGSRSGTSFEENFDEPSQVQSAFTTDFQVGVSVEASATLRAGGVVAESDFSHTVEFVDLQFFDTAGNDVSRWVNVTFDDPDFYMRSLASASIAPVPEPETYASLLAGLGLLGFAVRRRKLKPA